MDSSTSSGHYRLTWALGLFFRGGDCEGPEVSRDRVYLHSGTTGGLEGMRISSDWEGDLQSMGYHRVLAGGPCVPLVQGMWGTQLIASPAHWADLVSPCKFITPPHAFWKLPWPLECMAACCFIIVCLLFCLPVRFGSVLVLSTIPCLSFDSLAPDLCKYSVGAQEVVA